MKHPLAIALLGLALMLGAGGAHAQDDKKAAREKESLRRAQQALRAAQEKQSVLERDKAALALQLDTATRKNEGELAEAQKSARTSRAGLASAQSELLRLRAELDELRAGSEREKAALTTQAAQLTRSQQETQRLLDERTQTVISLGRLLDRSTKALANAERTNRELYASGRELLDRYRGKSVGDRLAEREPLFGLHEVQLENEAEALRTQLEAHRLPTTGAAAAKAPAPAP